VQEVSIETIACTVAGLQTAGRKGLGNGVDKEWWQTDRQGDITTIQGRMTGNLSTF
jgi:hypothetical protein